MELSQRLNELARNLYWAWHPEVVSVFRDLDVRLWREVHHNPMEMLARLAARAGGKASSPEFESALSRALEHLRDYLQSTNAWGTWNAGPLRVRPVAYFSAEFGIHESLPNYSGGLGVLAGDHLKAASDLAVPMVGIGLFYSKGYFDQALDRNGWQQERPSGAAAEALPLEPAVDAAGRPVRVGILLDGQEIKIGVWSAVVGRNRLLLLDSNVSGNSDFYRGLTAQLYGGDRNVRIRQEAILGIGGLRALRALGIWPGVVHLNEGHSAFAALELTRQLMERDGQPFRNMQEMASSMMVFTTHTPVEAGHDRFEAPLVEHVLGAFRRQLAIPTDDFMALGKVDPHNENEPFCMTVLGLKMSRYRNAVSALHGHISRAMWRGLWPERTRDEVPIAYITNGVHLGTWLADPMRQLYDRHFGPNWEERMHEPATWVAVDDIDNREFWKVDCLLRAHLVDYVRRCLQVQSAARGEPDRSAECLDPAALTVGFARRFSSYKRGDLVFRDLDQLQRLMGRTDRPIQFIISGKAHPRDDGGKRTIQHVYQLTQDPRFFGKVVFLENYNMNVARHLVQGVDLWLNNPRRPLEACGTSGQKVAVNAHLNLSVLDGWWAEAYDGDNGFAIGQGGEHSNWDHQDQLDLDALYAALENEVIPLFYQRDAAGIPVAWILRQKRALRTLAWRFSARRMVLDYTENCYLPAAGGLTASRAGVPFPHPTVPARRPAANSGSPRAARSSAV
jgi:glycogen phosphorylase